jgi:hypothetical protein
MADERARKLAESALNLPGVAPELNVNPDAAHAAMLADYYKQLPRSYLYFGYTSLIDLAVVKREVLDDFRRAPLHSDLYDCGPSLPVANSYPITAVSVCAVAPMPLKRSTASMVQCKAMSASDQRYRIRPRPPWSPMRISIMRFLSAGSFLRVRDK